MRIKYVLFLLACLAACTSPQKSSKDEKIPIKVVVVSMFERDNDTGDVPGEFQYWVENLPLDETIPFPQGYRDLRYNADKGVLGVVTGIGNVKAGVSIQALGLDPRFDLTDAYWLVAGISGVDPNDASTGSAVWADWIVDGDLSHEIDAREIPSDWETGYIPLRMTQPYELPMPDEREVVALQLKESLVDWAFQLTKDIKLPDTEGTAGMRINYEGYPAQNMPPKVMIGTQLAASTYWHGALFNEWANDWVAYWTEGDGNFVTSAMEEIGTWHALERLEANDLVDLERFLVLRTGSNFTMQWSGISAYESLSGEKLSGKGYSGYIPSLESAYLVGSAVVNELTQNWNHYQKNVP